MSKDNLSLSFGIKGMERTSFTHLNDEKVYTFARNSNIETDVENIALTNEHSNFLCSRFKPNYIVIGHKYDGLNNKVWFFITEKNANEDGKRISEIGYIQINNTVSELEDFEQNCGCDIISLLSKPLEEIEDIEEHCKYETFITDDCNNCLNFDPNYPVHNIILKQEAIGQTMTFVTKNNPPRYINLDEIEYYKYKGDIKCGIDNREPTCLDCEKLKIFPDHDQPYIYPEMINHGGNLRRGVYEFYIAYCDKLGNELTSYVSATNSVSIFDPDNIQLNQSTRYNESNYAIRLKVSNLDKKFNFYKIAVIEKTDVSEVTSAFEEGVHSIVDTNVIYATNGTENNQRISLNKLFLEKPVYKNFGGIVASNGILFGYDYEVEKEWNLQPVVNLMGSFVKWQTVEATEKLYEDGVNVALYKGYMRDEVYPLGISFITKSGYKTSVFPFIGRAPQNSELLVYNRNTGNKDVDSILENSPNCSVDTRNKKWQFYNTGEVLGTSYTDMIYPTGKIVNKNVEEECIQENIKIVENGRIEINIDSNFYNLEEWIIEHFDDICNAPTQNNPGSEYYNAELCELITDNISANCDTSDIFSFPVCDDYEDCYNKYCDLESEFYNEEKCRIIQENCDDGGCVGICTDIEKGDSSLYISSIENESNELLPKRYPWEIDDTIPTYNHDVSKNCNQFGQSDLNVQLRLKYRDDENDYKKDDFDIKNLKQRLEVYDNNDCITSGQLGYTGNFFNVDYTANIVVKSLKEALWGNDPEKHYHYLKNTETEIENTSGTVVLDKSTLLTDIIAPSYPNFENFIHNKALWYEVDFSENSEIFLEITPVRDLKSDATTLKNDDIRLTIYDKCNKYNVLFSTLYKSNDGYWKLLKKSDFGNKNKIYIALDTKLVTFSDSYKIEKDKFKIKVEYEGIATSSIPGCFDIKSRPIEYYKTIVTFDKLFLNKKTTFTSSCKFSAPSNVDCGVTPNKYGMFAYWESIEEYPDNKDLYDSSNVKLNLSKLEKYNSHTNDGEDVKLLNIFKNAFVQSLDNEGNIIWKQLNGKYKTDFRCENIRHFKFPDNNVIPFMNTTPLLNFSDSKIFPIGVTIDERTINVFLDAAVESNLITQEQRDSINGYEIYRGDRTVAKSIIMKGILNDMYQDPRDSNENQKMFFRNFPYNSLGKNQYITEDQERKTLISHPYSSTKNDRFSFIAPEVYYGRPKVPTEMVVDGYMYGNSLSKFTEVKDHSEWVILGDKAYKMAKKLATAEVLMEMALNIATMTIESSKNYWFTIGLSGGGNPIGTGVSLGALAIYIASQTLNLTTYKIPKLQSQWLEIFENRGSVYNFASMYVSQKGLYNHFKPNDNKGDMLRGMVSGKYLSNGIDVTTEIEGSKAHITVINNKDREDSIYIYTGSEYTIKYPQQYSTYDNVDTSPRNSSRYINSDSNCKDNVLTKRIASPYVSLKNYVPDQYGKIDEIKWLSVNHDPIFNDESKNIFGGDIFISRTDLKNKIRFFNKDAIGLANRTPFKYSTASNIGYSKFYVDHKSSDEAIGSNDMPYLSSSYNMDCRQRGSRFYEGSPSKFYLFAYAVPYFLTESEINSNYRYAGTEYHEQFASRGLNIDEWVQEKNVSIAHNNIFYYNSVYSRNQTGLRYRTLPSFYDKHKWDLLADSENGVAWSEQDNSEISLSDPWMVFKPFNIYRFPFSFGKLISLNNIESTQVMGRFADNMAVFNAVDILRDRITPDNEELGTGGIFAQRPMQFSYTELGETGSQHRSMVSTEFGHFWVDAKRGKIFLLEPNAKGLKTISDFRNSGEESGMRRWFKKHLPFKILKGKVLNLNSQNVDNTFKGLGILMWWDSRFKRIFITKKDYIAKENNIEYHDGNFYINTNGNLTEVQLTDVRYFKDVSWTVSYSPIYDSWLSYYDFKPDYAISYNDFFQTGLNYSSDNKELGVWSHLLSNKSYQVFYGKYYPWEIELPIKNEYTNKILSDVKIWSVSERYHDNFDYAIWREKSFNKMIIYNQTNNSGILNLKYDNSINKSKYPIYISPIEQGIKANHFDEQIWINYFYNRVRKENNHIPVWNSDPNEIYKDLNPDAISFNSKKILERIRGDWFLIRLVQDNTSQFKQYFKWMVGLEKPYQ